jgi:threonine/homoserine/homoserine lactone efflux protein
MITAFITGMLMSFIGSIAPTGPIALIVLKRSLRREHLNAIALVSGAALAEAGYALLAYLGINFALAHYPIQTSILRMFAGILLIAFALFFIFDGHSHQPKNSNRSNVGANFLMGLSIAGLNPTFLITWIGAVTAARSMGLISDIHAAPGFALGVVVGPIVWFYILLKFINYHMDSIHPETLAKIEKALPLILLGLAAYILTQAFSAFL